MSHLERVGRRLPIGRSSRSQCTQRGRNACHCARQVRHGGRGRRKPKESAHLARVQVGREAAAAERGEEVGQAGVGARQKAGHGWRGARGGAWR